MSTFTYSWTYIQKDHNELLKDNKKFFKEQMEESIKHVEKMMENLNCYFLDTDLIENLKRKKEKFLKNYTMEILQSSNHIKWVNSQVAKFQEIVRKTKEYIILVKTEFSDDLDLKALKAFIDAIPEGANDLRRKIQKIKELFENLEKEAKNPNMNLQTLESYLKMFPESLCNIRFCKEMKQYVEFLRSIENVGVSNLNANMLEEYLRKVPDEYYGILRKIKQKLLEKKMWSTDGQSNDKQIIVEENNLKEKKQEILKKIENIYSKLKNINFDLAEKNKHLIEEAREIEDLQRLEFILEELKFNYVKAKKLYVQNIQTEVLKSDLRVFERAADETGLKNEFNRLMQASVLNKEEVDKFIKKILEKQRQIIEKKTEKTSVLDSFMSKIRELGYSILEESTMEKLSEGEVVEIKTPFGEDYVLKIKYENDTLAIRFVRYVEDEENLSEYEKQKDIYIAKKWCSDFDKIKEFLKQKGIMLEDKKRIEPEERFYYVKKEKIEEAMNSQRNKNIEFKQKPRSV